MRGYDDVLDYWDYSVDHFEGMGPNFIFWTLGQCLVGDKSDMPYYLDTNLYLDKKIVLDLSRSIHSTIFLRDLKFYGKSNGTFSSLSILISSLTLGHWWGPKCNTTWLECDFPPNIKYGRCTTTNQSISC